MTRMGNSEMRFWKRIFMVSESEFPELKNYRNAIIYAYSKFCKFNNSVNPDSDKKMKTLKPHIIVILLLFQKLEF
jgi:hypothetical protein